MEIARLWSRIFDQPVPVPNPVFLSFHVHPRTSASRTTPMKTTHSLTPHELNASETPTRIMPRLLCLLFTLGLAARLATVSAQDVSFLADGLLAYYPLDGNANDASGNGLHGVAIGTPLATEDRFGRPVSAFSFAWGVCGQFTVPGTENLHLMSGLSVCAWFKVRPHNQILLLGKHIINYPNGYLLEIFEGGVMMHAHDSAVSSTPDGAVYDGRWHHVVGTCDGKVGRLYVDGVLRDISTSNRVAPNDAPFTIGGVTGGCEFYDGALDEVRLYSRPLSDAEAKALYEYDERAGSVSHPSYVKSDLVQQGTWTAAPHNSPITGISVLGTKAVVTCGDSVARLLEVRDPAAPALLGSWSTPLPVSDAVLAGNVAYVASWEPDFLSTVEIVDFTDPAKPVLMGYYDTPGYAQELLLRGDILFVADSEGGLLVLDVSDPSHPSRLGGYDTHGSIEHVEVTGSTAYLAGGNWLVILDVSDPSTPRRVGLYEVPAGISSLEAYGTQLYLSDGGGGLQILDVNEPASIQLLGTYSGWGNPAQAMAVSGRYLYLAKGTGWLHALDVNDPTNPIYVTGTCTSPAEDVAVSGKNILVAGGDKGLVVYELQQDLYPPLPAPVLSAGMMTLTWATTDDVRLQKTTNLLNAVWTDVPESEGTNTLTLPMTEPTTFFRLVKGPKQGQVPEGLVAWWSGEGNANDIIGTNHGTLMNGAAFADGIVGQCFSLDGIDDFLLVPDAPEVDFCDNTPMTIELWAFCIGGNTGNFHLVGKRPDCSYPIQFQLSHDGGGLAFGSGYWSSPLYVTFDPPLNEWVHYAATFDGITTCIYVNGSLVGTGAGPLGPKSSEPFEIGNAGTCEPFNGLIDEVSLYNRALTAAEIKAIYDAGSAGKAKP